MDELERQEQLLRQAMQELEETSTVTADSFFRLNRETSKLGKTIEKAEDAIDKFWRGPVGKTTKALGDLASGTIRGAQAARQNRESFESLNPVIEGAASALAAIPIVGDALGKTLSTVGTFVTSELQKSVESFQTLGSVGAVGAEGVSGLRKSAELAGLSFEQLAKITGDKSGGLAFAFGTTANGLKAIAQLTKAAEPFRGQLLSLGFGMQQQSEIFADYIERSARLGRRQTTDVRVLGQQSAEYAKNLSRLSRLTGMSADAVQSELDAQMSNIRFRRAVSELPDTAERAVSNFGIAVAGISKDPNFTRGIQDLVAGQGTAAATAVSVATGNAAQGIIDRLKAGVISEEQAYNELRAATADIYARTPAQVFGRGSILDEAALGIANVATSSVDFAAALKQGEGAAKALDPATKGMVDAQLSLQRFATEADKFVNDKVFPRATSVISKLTDGLDHLARGVNSIAGVQPRAKGGPIDAGSPYLVGEQGPELIVPRSSGNVIPNDQLSLLQKLQGADYHTIRDEIMRQQYRLDTYEDRLIAFLRAKAESRLPGETAFIKTQEFQKFRETRNNMESLITQLSKLMSDAPVTQPISRAEIPTISRGQTTKNVMGRDVTFDSTTRTSAEDSIFNVKNYEKHAARLGLESLDIPHFEKGGIATGPKSGYNSILHGTEAVVPLPNGKSIPVESSSAGSDGKLVGLMESMNDILQQVAANTRTGADTSKKLLRASTA